MNTHIQYNCIKISHFITSFISICTHACLCLCGEELTLMHRCVYKWGIEDKLSHHSSDIIVLFF